MTGLEFYSRRVLAAGTFRGRVRAVREMLAEGVIGATEALEILDRADRELDDAWALPAAAPILVHAEGLQAPASENGR